MSNIWVIRPGALGDTILTLPLLSTLKKANPRAEIKLLGSRAYHEIVPDSFSFKPVDDRESVWLFQSEGIAGMPNTEKPDEAYVILRNPETVVSNLEAAGVRNILQANPSPVLGQHLVETIHARLGLPCPDRYPVLRINKMVKTENLVWVHPGSGSSRKTVPVTLFAEISRIMHKKLGCKIVITLGEADKEIKSHSQWKAWIDESHPTVIENGSLKELATILAASRTFIGNDSGISHLASGLGIQSILFFTETDPVQWAPWVRTDQLKILDYRSSGLPGDFANEASRIVGSTLENFFQNTTL
ncbi:MAG: glycosyltransferase family 9 protein [Pseudomonadota bacterium]